MDSIYLYKEEHFVSIKFSELVTILSVNTILKVPFKSDERKHQNLLINIVECGARKRFGKAKKLSFQSRNVKQWE